MKITAPEKRYLSAKFVKENKLKDKPLTISDVSEEEMQDGKSKYVIHFLETEKGLVLNATNRDILIAEFEDESANWAGKTIAIAVTKTKYEDKLVDSMQVYVPEK